MYAKKEAGRKVTETLDLLFADSYDRRFRPGFGSGPTDIEVTSNYLHPLQGTSLHTRHLLQVNIFIRSMGPIDESLQKFTFDCYFRQFWTDRRLAFNNSNADFKVIIINWRNVRDRADGCSIIRSCL